MKKNASVGKTQNLEIKRQNLSSDIYAGRLNLKTVEQMWPSNRDLREALYVLVKRINYLPSDEIAKEMLLTYERDKNTEDGLMETVAGLDHTKVTIFIHDITYQYPQHDLLCSEVRDSKRAVKFTEMLKRRYSPVWVFLFCKAMGKLFFEPNYNYSKTQNFLAKEKKRGRKSKLNLPAHTQYRSLYLINQSRRTLAHMIEEHMNALNWRVDVSQTLVNHVALYGLDFIVRTILDLHFAIQRGELSLTDVDVKLRETMTLSTWFAGRISDQNRSPEFCDFLARISNFGFIMRPTVAPNDPLEYNYEKMKLMDAKLRLVEFSDPSKSKVEKEGEESGAKKRLSKSSGKRSKSRHSK